MPLNMEISPTTVAIVPGSTPCPTSAATPLAWEISASPAALSSTAQAKYSQNALVFIISIAVISADASFSAPVSCFPPECDFPDGSPPRIFWISSFVGFTKKNPQTAITARMIMPNIKKEFLHASIPTPEGVTA